MANVDVRPHECDCARNVYAATRREDAYRQALEQLREKCGQSPEVRKIVDEALSPG